MTWHHSLRVRLSAGFVLFAAVIIGIAAIAVVMLVEQMTLGALDAVLMEEATTLSTLADVPGTSLETAVREVGKEADMTGGRKFVRVRAADGSILAVWKRMPPVVREQDVPGEVVYSAGEDDAIFRIAAVRAASGTRVVVGAHATRRVRLVQRARWLTGILATSLLALLGLGAWVFTGRATREIDRLAVEIESIEAGTLERRLPARETVEVDRLVTVLNRVLARLERSVGQMRRFSADAAHELRTPIAALRTRLEVGLRRNGGDVSRDVVVDALGQAERLGRLAEDLLTLTRLEGGAVADYALDHVVSLDALVNEVATVLQPLAEEQGRYFRWECLGGLRVRGSEPLLKRIVVNVLDNAFRHTPPSAGVVLRTERDGDGVVIVVHDDGPGIPPELVPHLFQRFRHGRGSGTGLGLAIVREIAARHGGTVTVESGAERGTVVRVRLPLVAAEASVDGPASAPTGLSVARRAPPSPRDA
jgi:signal transduction histidine kinase